MFKARLEQRLESGEPKCANCAYWLRWIVVNDLTPLPESEMPFGHCQRLEHKVEPPTTTDLTVCSKWEMKDEA